MEAQLVGVSAETLMWVKVGLGTIGIVVVGFLCGIILSDLKSRNGK